jgi:hypothetical protein
MRLRLLLSVLAMLLAAFTVVQLQNWNVTAARRTPVPLQAVKLAPTERPVPPSWTRHEFNDSQYYIIPLATG